MDADHSQHGQEPGKRLFHWFIRLSIVLAAIYALIEHREHLVGALPYLILLACPLMHLMHGGHRHHHPRHDEGDVPGSSQGHAP